MGCDSGDERVEVELGVIEETNWWYWWKCT